MNPSRTRKSKKDWSVRNRKRMARSLSRNEFRKAM